MELAHFFVGGWTVSRALRRDCLRLRSRHRAVGDAPLVGFVTGSGRERHLGILWGQVATSGMMEISHLGRLR